MKQTSTRIAALFFVLLLGITNLFAAKAPKETDANIFGHVLDAKTREHLVGVTISIKGTTFGTATDQTGHYFLKGLKPGKITLVMSGVGYLSQEKTIEIKDQQTLEVNFEAEEDNVSLDEIVVTANRQNTLRRLAPTLVQVVDEKQFSKVNAQNLVQGLSFQPGLRVENNCQNCGFNQVRINGLQGHYTQVLIDSRPVVSALAGVYGFEQIPANMVDRVEVVRCGGSALYGSSAIGGVINVITKEPTHNSFSLNSSLSLVGMKNADNSFNFNGALVSDNNRAGVVVFGQARDRSPWDKNGDGFSELGKLKARSLGSRVFFRPTDYTRLSAEVHTIEEYRRGGDHIDLPDHVAMVSEHLDHSIYSGNAKFDLFSHDYKHHWQLYASGQWVNRKSYYGSLKDGATYEDENGKQVIGTIGSPVPPSLYGINFGVTQGRTFMGGSQYTYDIDRLLFLPAQLLLGVEASYDYLHDRMPLRYWTPITNEDGTIKLGPDGKPLSLYPAIKQQIANYSQIAQLEWKNDEWSILLGTRFDEHSLVKKPIISPRATLRFNPTKNINLRASYAKGFRAPQLFDEDLHVSVINGESQRIINAEGLSPENSHAVSLSSDLYFRCGEVQANVLIDGYYTRLLDVFVTKELPSEGDGIIRYRRSNGAGATVAGVNVEAKIAYRKLQFQTGWTYTYSRYDQEQEWGQRASFKNNLPVMTEVTDDSGAKSKVYNVAQTSKEFMRTPSLYGYFTFGIEACKNLNLSLTGNFTGSMLAPHVIEFGAGSALSDIAAGNKPFKGLPKDDTDNDSSIRIDELVKTPSFFELGTKIGYTLKVLNASDLELYVGMNNLFDSFQKDFDLGAGRDSAYIYGPMQPRTGYAGFKLTF